MECIACGEQWKSWTDRDPRCPSCGFSFVQYNVPGREPPKEKSTMSDSLEGAYGIYKCKGCGDLVDVEEHQTCPKCGQFMGLFM